MKNKERFEIKDRWLVDTENNYKQIYAVDSYIDRPVIDLLNQQDKEIKQLKQSQNQKAIEVLEDIRKTIRYAKEICGGKATDLDIVSANAYNRCLDDMQKIIDNQIKSLKGEK